MSLSPVPTIRLPGFVSTTGIYDPNVNFGATLGTVSIYAIVNGVSNLLYTLPNMTCEWISPIFAATSGSIANFIGTNVIEAVDFVTPDFVNELGLPDSATLIVKMVSQSGTFTIVTNMATFGMISSQLM